jgi:hypothetical protein
MDWAMLLLPDTSFSEGQERFIGCSGIVEDMRHCRGRNTSLPLSDCEKFLIMEGGDGGGLTVRGL